MSDGLATILGRLRARVEQDPDRHLAACGGRWNSVGQAYDRARRLAAGLYQLGVRPGDRVASMMANRDEALDVLFGCAALGAVHVPLNMFLKGSSCAISSSTPIQAS